MINLKCDCIEELINASQGYIKNDTVFENIKILNVFTKEWIYAHVYIYKKWISHVEYNVDKPLMNSKNIVNFAKYKHLLLFSAKYLELTEKEKKNFTIEMLFNLFETDFKDKIINKEINKHLNVYDYCYAILNK